MAERKRDDRQILVILLILIAAIVVFDSVAEKLTKQPLETGAHVTRKHLGYLPGWCGDGRITPPERCDVKKDRGCATSAGEFCVKCKACISGSDTDFFG